MKFNMHSKGDKVIMHDLNNGKLTPVTIIRKIWYEEGLEYKVRLPGGGTRVVSELQLPSMERTKESRYRVMITVFGRHYACEVYAADRSNDRYYSNSILGCIKECPAKRLDANAIGKKFESRIKSNLAESKKILRSMERKIKKFERLMPKTP